MMAIKKIFLLIDHYELITKILLCDQNIWFGWLMRWR